MQNIKEKYLERVQELILKGESSLTELDRHGYIEASAFAEWETSCLNFLQGLPLAKSKNVFYDKFDSQVNPKYMTKESVNYGIGILSGLQEDIEKGLLESGAELVKAEVFTDLLEMAEYLLEQGYKDPAASLAGAVLEIELRNLCSRKGIDVKKADDISCLNGKLKDKDVYSQVQRSSIEAWKKIRDAAAHGKHEEYTENQVKDFLSGLRRFIGEYLG